MHPQVSALYILLALSIIGILGIPLASVITLSGTSDHSLIFAVRVWCENENYWPIYHDLTQKVVEQFQEQGIREPELQIRQEKA